MPTTPTKQTFESRIDLWEKLKVAPGPSSRSEALLNKLGAFLSKLTHWQTTNRLCRDYCECSSEQ